MILAVVLAFALVAVTFVFRYRVLLWLGTNTPKLNLPTHTQVLVIVVVLFLTHIVEIGIYAVTYSLSVSSFELGIFRGSPVTDAMSYLYYQGAVYTALGLGDIQPESHIRFITAMEAL
ncbi:hypothetical protein [Pseudomaricurvus alkylphenolicus]|uniref:hypothetical protein n=1 Tax=Pseudomaricurvus alkylphenolicus TaxID=1306991 RepID=UPI00197FAF2E|nr:hypothetical protein [Pseudomaricurvus alkylphenolicus]